MGGSVVGPKRAQPVGQIRDARFDILARASMRFEIVGRGRLHVPILERPSLEESFPGMPDMLTIICGRASEGSRMPFENCPGIRMPRCRSTNSVWSSIEPEGAMPALAGAITSAASDRASASAIWLRQEFAAHTKSTFTGWDICRRVYLATEANYEPLRVSCTKYSCTALSSVSSG